MNFGLINESGTNKRIELVPVNPNPTFFELLEPSPTTHIDPVTGALSTCLAPAVLDCQPKNVFAVDNHEITVNENGGAYIGYQVGNGPIQTAKILTTWRPGGKSGCFEAVIEAIGQEGIEDQNALYDNFQFSGIDNMGNPNGDPFGIVGMEDGGPIKRPTDITLHDLKLATDQGINLYTENGFPGDSVVLHSCGPSWPEQKFFKAAVDPSGAAQLVLYDQFNMRVDTIDQTGKQTIHHEEAFNGYQVREMMFSPQGSYMAMIRDDFSGEPGDEEGKWPFKVFTSSKPDGSLPWIDDSRTEVSIDHSGLTILGAAQLVWDAEEQWMAVIPWQGANNIHIYQRQEDGSFKRQSSKAEPNNKQWRDVAFAPDLSFVFLCSSDINDPIENRYSAYDFNAGDLTVLWETEGTWRDLPAGDDRPANYQMDGFHWYDNTNLLFMRVWGYQQVTFDKANKKVIGKNMTTYPIYTPSEENVSYNNFVIRGNKLVTITDLYVGGEGPQQNISGISVATYNPTTKTVAVPALADTKVIGMNKPTGDTGGLHFHPDKDNLIMTVGALGPWYTQWWNIDGAKPVLVYPNGDEPTGA